MRHSKAPEADGKRAAILVVHGIGEQRPYETVDAFARGIASKAGAPERLSHLLFELGTEPASAVRMKLTVPVGLAQARNLDIYELYWAGDVQGRIKLRQVLGWVARTSLTPLRAWSVQPMLLFRERGAMRRKALIFLRELFRAFLLMVLAAGIVLPFAYAAREARQVAGVARSLFDAAVTAVPTGGAAMLFVLWVLVVFTGIMLARGWLRLLHARRGAQMVAGTWQGTEQQALSWWRKASATAILALTIPAVLLPWLTGFSLLNLVRSVASAISAPPVYMLLGAGVLAWLLRKPLVSYIGDIALYVTADERSEFFRLRQHVLKRSTSLLRWLLMDAGYDSVYVAGHSLGSVIAYDTINRLICEARAETHTRKTTTLRDALDRLHGLLTFGSPLDKIYYFFRQEVGPAEAIRAQILSSLHGFRKMSSGREYGTLKLEPYDVPLLENLLWYNVYSRSDPVSGYLDFYRVDKQVVCRYWNPFSAHLAYWNDEGFYDTVLEWLTWEVRGAIATGLGGDGVAESSQRFRRAVEGTESPA